MVVIGAMLATALAVGNPLAAVGAVLFVGSDSMIAWNRFVGTLPGASVLDHGHLPPGPGRPGRLAPAVTLSSDNVAGALGQLGVKPAPAAGLPDRLQRSP